MYRCLIILVMATKTRFKIDCINRLVQIAKNILNTKLVYKYSYFKNKVKTLRFNVWFDRNKTKVVKNLDYFY